MPQEYKPKSKNEVEGESIERTPGSKGVTLLNDDSYGQGTDSGNESYFVLELPEMAAYTGNPHNGRRPKVTFKSGSAYTGEWRNNARHGVGRHEWADGASFHGQWRNNCADGIGRFVHADGDVFIGEWRSNAASGKGVYQHRQGLMTYKGEWLKDLQHGHGCETWENGSSYNGQVVLGKKHGCGVYAWPDGSLYSGEWEANSASGYGHYLGKDGREFRGMWKDSLIHGCGSYSWPDGRKFSGQYVQDLKEGFGIYSYEDGKTAQGFWHHSKQHGHGILYSAESDDGNREIIKKGIWRMGKDPPGYGV
jgi:hypothetical protein